MFSTAFADRAFFCVRGILEKYPEGSKICSEAFQNVVGVTGLVVTKLDGSARGGVVVALAERFGLPIHAIGVGEDINDLQAFKANEFAHGLMNLTEGI